MWQPYLLHISINVYFVKIKWAGQNVLFLIFIIYIYLFWPICMPWKHQVIYFLPIRYFLALTGQVVSMCTTLLPLLSWTQYSPKIPSCITDLNSTWAASVRWTLLREKKKTKHKSEVAPWIQINRSQEDLYSQCTATTHSFNHMWWTRIMIDHIYVSWLILYLQQQIKCQVLLI